MRALVPNKPMFVVENDRPMSLMNIDAAVFSRTLAHRIKLCISRSYAIFKREFLLGMQG